MEPADSLADELAELAGLLFTRDSLDTTLQLVANTAVHAIPSCDAAGVSLADNGRVVTAAASGPLVHTVDRHQYETSEGPCLDTLRTGESRRSELLQHEQRWPAFRPRALQEGVVSCLAIPLAVGGGTAGALNLYSRQSLFEARDEEIGQGFAVPASVALANARAYAKSQAMISQLEEALQSRDVIGQAKGIIMQRDACSADMAFDRLRELSQHSNVKLRDIAIRVVDEAGTRKDTTP